MGEMMRTLPAAEWYDEVPRSINRQIVVSLLAMLVTMGGFGLWAFTAPLASAVIAHGSFVATGRNKIIQHFEGGIIQDILVDEGALVTAGQTILRLDRTSALANERELVLRQARLEATAARLIALHQRLPKLTFPDSLEALRDDPMIAAILDNQALSFEVEKQSVHNDLALIEKNIEALGLRKRGYSAQLGTHRGQLLLLDEEFKVKLGLLKTGLVRSAEASALQRAKLETHGQIARLESEIAEIDQMRLKYMAEKEQLNGERSRAALSELQSIGAELESIREKARKAENVLDRADVEAPVAGTVVRLYYHTTGGVVESGRPIAEILPSDAPLIIEVKIPRIEIDSVSTGQAATVRLIALNQRTTPILYGTVIYVSADAIVDKTDAMTTEAYVARVSLSPEELQRVPGFVPTPGMPADMMIQTGERTFMQYLIRPIVDSMAHAFREK